VIDARGEHAGSVPNIHSEAALKIGRRVREVRHRLGISLEDLGELSEISWTSIGKIERGVSSPTAETLVRLATALEVDPGSFLSGLTADGARLHQLSARDLIRARAEQGGGRRRRKA
jgi:transcriptional regulator with XRE-family HTH domain